MVAVGECLGDNMFRRVDYTDRLSEYMESLGTEDDFKDLAQDAVFEDDRGELSLSEDELEQIQLMLEPDISETFLLKREASLDKTRQAFEEGRGSFRRSDMGKIDRPSFVIPTRNSKDRL